MYSSKESLFLSAVLFCFLFFGIHNTVIKAADKLSVGPFFGLVTVARHIRHFVFNRTRKMKTYRFN